MDIPGRFEPVGRNGLDPRGDGFCLLGRFFAEFSILPDIPLILLPKVRVIPAKRGRIIVCRPHRAVLAQTVFRKRLTADLGQVNGIQVVGRLAEPWARLAKFAEERRETVLEKQQVLLAQEGLVVFSVAQGLNDQRANPLLGPGRRQNWVSFAKVEPHDLDGVHQLV